MLRLRLEVVGGAIRGEEALQGRMRNTNVKYNVLGVHRRLSVDDDIFKKRRALRLTTAANAEGQH
jgi:hypothetical protein